MVRRMFVADSDKENTRNLREVFEKIGFSVTTASNDDEVDDKIRNRIFDIVIIELFWPKADGFKFVSRIKDKSKDTSIITITNRDSLEVERAARNLGAYSYFAKPVEIERLKDMVSSIAKNN